jgi:hypothetical protein
MLIDGWQIDENELHNFNKRWRAKWSARDRLFECQSADIACLIHSIVEVAMNRLVGRLAVYRCKTNPALVVNPRHFECRFWDSDDPVEYSGNGTVLFAKGGSRFSNSVSFCVIDVESRQFAMVRNGEPAFSPAVHEITERTFRLDFSSGNGNLASALIDLGELKWHGLWKL